MAYAYHDSASLSETAARLDSLGKRIRHAANDMENRGLKGLEFNGEQSRFSGLNNLELWINQVEMGLRRQSINVPPAASPPKRPRKKTG